MVEDAEQQIASSGRILDAVVWDVESARTAIDAGARMISLSDRDVLAASIRDFLAEIGSRTPAGE